MRFFLTVLGVTFVVAGVAQAELQMSSGPDYGSYIITGDQGYFDVYLRFPSSNASVTAYQGANVMVTDFGVTAKQNHLFRVIGFNSQPFQIAGYGWATEVLDASMSRIGVYSDELDPAFHADAGGPYTIGQGQSLTLDAGLSYLAKNHGWNPGANSLVSPDSIDPAYWKVDGKSVGSFVSFDTLVNELGLSYGMHTVSLDATAAWMGVFPGYPYLLNDSAVTTLQIIPEPATLVLLGFGAVIIKSKRSKGKR
jgi:hypothetical protein